MRHPLNTFRQRFSFAYLVLNAVFSFAYYGPLMFAPNLFGSVRNTIIANPNIRTLLLLAAIMVASSSLLSLRCDSQRMAFVTGFLTVGLGAFMAITFTVAAIVTTHDPARPEVWWWVTLTHSVFFWIRMHPAPTTSDIQAKLKEDIATVIERLTTILTTIRDED